MKKIFILLAVILSCVNGVFAQHVHDIQQLPVKAVGGSDYQHGSSAERTTVATGDTLILQNTPDSEAHTVYAIGGDSGYVYGTNYWNDQQFAEQYNMADSDINVQVIGVMALFAGTVNPSTTQTLTFYVWDQGPQQLITGSLYYNGFPNNILDSLVQPVNQIGIGTTADTLKSYFFPAPTGYIDSAFFIGYGIYYDYLELGGDTIGLASTINGTRNPAGLYTVSTNISIYGDTSYDTTINVQNATFGADNLWYDNFTQYDSQLVNLAVYPIVIAGPSTGTKGITRNNFTYYGNYPNPCNEVTNIQFGLTMPADVTVQVTDMAGHVLNTIKQSNLATGEHIITVNTASMPAGDYLYLIRTSDGDGIAGKITVLR